MKKVVVIAVVALGMVILTKSGIFDSLMLFILAGIIPGTTYAIPSSFMLLLMMSIAWLVFFHLLPLETTRSNTLSGKKKPTAKKRLPKQRYKQI